jgi:hypothetical protein
MLKNYEIIRAAIAFALLGLFIGICRPFTGLAAQGHEIL